MLADRSAHLLYIGTLCVRPDPLVAHSSHSEIRVVLCRTGLSLDVDDSRPHAAVFSDDTRLAENRRDRISSQMPQCPRSTDPDWPTAGSRRPEPCFVIGGSVGDGLVGTVSPTPNSQDRRGAYQTGILVRTGEMTAPVARFARSARYVPDRRHFTLMTFKGARSWGTLQT